MKKFYLVGTFDEKIMKSIIVTFLIPLSFLTAYAQKDTTSFFFNEFDLTLNRTNLINDNTKDRFGFGLGAFRSMMEPKKVNLIFGVEYNLTSQLKKSIYMGHFAHATDVEYTIHNLSIPLNFRYNIGNKVKFFLQIGTFVDLIISSSRKGIMHTYLPDQNNKIVYKKFSFKEKAGLRNLNYGFSGGIGLRIPITKMELTIKTGYNLGLNNLSVDDNVYNRYFRLTVGLKI